MSMVVRIVQVRLICLQSNAHVEGTGKPRKERDSELGTLLLQLNRHLLQSARLV